MTDNPHNLPWTALRHNGWERIVFNANEDVVATTVRHDVVEFIVKAVNAHDELVAALEQCAEWFKGYGDGHAAKGDADKAKRNHDREAVARAALAKAKGDA